jgi:hypothetical protein
MSDPAVVVSLSSISVAPPNSDSVALGDATADLPIVSGYSPALVALHGRDSPSGSPLHSQLSRASLLGRAPPTSA